MVVGRILPLASAWLTIFFVYLLTIIISPLLYLIIGQLHLTFFEAGLVIVAPVTVLVFLSVLGGLLGDKYQFKWLVTLGITIMGLVFLAG
jgi:MFS family permease